MIDIDPETLNMLRFAKDETSKQRIAQELYNEIYDEEITGVDNRLNYI